LALSRIVNSIVSGTPLAVADAEPMLDRMSARTTPAWVRMFLPFEPSPGNGPAVSSGIVTHEVVAAVVTPPAVVELAAEADVVAPVVDEVPAAPEVGVSEETVAPDVAGLAFELLEHAANSAAVPKAPSALNAARRDMVDVVSKAGLMLMTHDLRTAS
jgi:hypothetical protein